MSNPADFPVIGTVHYIYFWDIKIEFDVSQPTVYRACSDCMDVQAS